MQDAPTGQRRDREPQLFSARDDAFVIYNDRVSIRAGKEVVFIPIDHIAGVVYGRALPMYGEYRLTIVYLGEDGQRRMAASVFAYRQVAEAIRLLEKLALRTGDELVVRPEPYPLAPAFAVLGLLVIPGFAVTLRGGSVGVLILCLLLASVLGAIELLVESRHRPKPRVKEQ